MDEQNNTASTVEATKFCKHCGQKIDKDAVICPHCGCQIEEIKNKSGENNPQVIITNTNTNTNAAFNPKVRVCNKWVAFFLCFFLGVFGAHKFYEHKIILGILYIFTAGLFGIGWFIDLITILFKPNPYCV